MKQLTKQKIKPSLLPGFMELSPKEQLIFNDMVNRMIKVYEQNGCMPIETPLIEKEEILLAKSAGETEKQVYRIHKEKTKQALRFDLTVPFARYVVQHMNELTFPFKRYQLGKVYRGERNQKGRYREFYQLDIDVVNPTKLAITNDAFVMSLAAKAFEAIGLTNYGFQISNRKILSGLLMLLGIERQQEAMGIIDKYDKIGGENCLRELESLMGIDNAQAIEALLQIRGESLEMIRQLKALGNQLCKRFSSNENTEVEAGYLKMIEGIEELEEVICTLDILGVKEHNFSIQLKIVRGLDYYTGTIFETIMKGNEQYGSICSGGRYDNLSSLYTDFKIPGVGISIGITRLFFILQEIGFFDTYAMPRSESCLVMPLGDTLKACIEVNESLQAKGMRSEVYLNQDSLKKQLKYANAQGVDMAIIIGEDEMARGEVILKNMKTGEQTKVEKEIWLQYL